MSSTAQRPAVRAQSMREEAANALSHGVGFLLAALSLQAAGTLTRPGHDRIDTGVVVFSLSMMLVYGASMLYHALPHGCRARPWFNRLDHAAIFVAIAGSFTPFGLASLGDDAGRAGFVLVWALAGAGVVAKAGGRLRCPLRSTALYMALGWTALLAALPALHGVAAEGLWLVVAGGVAYSVGAGFFLSDHRVPYGHFVWHLFVLVGSGCHFVAAVQHLS